MPIRKLLGPKPLLFLGIAYTLIITIALLIPARDIPRATFIPGDKVVHAAIHIILVFVWLTYALQRKLLVSSWPPYAAIVLFCLAYGIIIELFQEWITHSRNADFYDVLANGIGTLLGLALFLKLKQKFVQ